MEFNRQPPTGDTPEAVQSQIAYLAANPEAPDILAAASDKITAIFPQDLRQEVATVLDHASALEVQLQVMALRRLWGMAGELRAARPGEYTAMARGARHYLEMWPLVLQRQISMTNEYELAS